MSVGRVRGASSKVRASGCARRARWGIDDENQRLSLQS
ncbi:hypothetical protein D779_3515 [Imhoffiella purpurea]|uniref:Uncharacterized protein n=1 Tax=Imhoffiella purpurea TaxID=1249627 RepID=W9V2A0_9GAMM|nr:hypothetical protein D779_3515 [Imhoffiella purpurea]